MTENEVEKPLYPHTVVAFDERRQGYQSTMVRVPFTVWAASASDAVRVVEERLTTAPFEDFECTRLEVESHRGERFDAMVTRARGVFEEKGVRIQGEDAHIGRALLVLRVMAGGGPFPAWPGEHAITIQPKSEVVS